MCLYRYRHLNRILWSVHRNQPLWLLWAEATKSAHTHNTPCTKKREKKIQIHPRAVHIRLTGTPQPPLTPPSPVSPPPPHTTPPIAYNKSSHGSSRSTARPMEVQDRLRPPQQQHKLGGKGGARVKFPFVAVLRRLPPPPPPPLLAPRRGYLGGSPWSSSRLSYRAATWGRTGCRAGRAARG